MVAVDFGSTARGIAVRRAVPARARPIATTASQPSPSTATARTTATIVTATAHTSSVRLVRVAAAARIRVLLAEKVLDILHFLKRGPSFIPGASFKKQALIWILASMWLLDFVNSPFTVALKEIVSNPYPYSNVTFADVRSGRRRKIIFHFLLPGEWRSFKIVSTARAKRERRCCDYLRRYIVCSSNQTASFDMRLFHLAGAHTTTSLPPTYTFAMVLFLRRRFKKNWTGLLEKVDILFLGI